MNADNAMKAEFEEQVRQLLSHLYDYLKLVENPVARRLAGDHSGPERNRAIRGAVMAAIEMLRRDRSGGPAARGNRVYNILLLRYIEEQPTSEILNQLALSERQYYREHQRAIQTISQVLWDQHFAATAQRAPQPLAEELTYLSRERGPASFDARAEIEAAINATTVIARQRNISIRLDAASAQLQLNIAQPVFRQLVIVMLNQFIGAHESPEAVGEIHISVGPGRVISFRAAVDISELAASLREDATVQALTRSLNARLDFQAAGITLSLAEKAQSILVVDDNPDSILLLKRYLANLPYQLLSAQEEAEALSIAQGAPLLCVILDVMLPGKDGWQILQRFKNNPATAEIPVLICSVLEMEELALSLGADGYLKKPPAREELLTILNAWT